MKSAETGTTRTIEANSSGGYDVSLLGIGSYEVNCHATRFQKATKKITLVLGQHANVDFALGDR